MENMKSEEEEEEEWQRLSVSTDVADHPHPIL